MKKSKIILKTALILIALAAVFALCSCKTGALPPETETETKAAATTKIKETTTTETTSAETTITETTSAETTATETTATETTATETTATETTATETTATETTTAETTATETTATEIITEAETTATETEAPGANGYVSYSQFGAVGDGITDDFTAIYKTHEYANKNKLKVKADAGFIYYIGASSVGNTAIIRTDTDFGNAEFIIDDTLVPASGTSYRAYVFSVESYRHEYNITINEKPRYGQTSLDITLSEKSLLKLNNNKQMVYIRSGEDANNGYSAREVVICDENGRLDADTPITWDYVRVPTVTVYPIDAETLTVSGGVFTTRKNTEVNSRAYYTRGINIRRSNVTVTGLTHLFEKPWEGSAPYNGFIHPDTCSNITVKDCVLTPLYISVDRTGETVKKVGGGYDMSAVLTTGFKVINVTQTISVTDSEYWGIFKVDFSRNVEFDSCILTRFDAHMGVYNATIKNCTLGYQGINAIGFGLLYVENTTVQARRFINLRHDYGGTWRGDIVIKNCTLKPASGGYGNISLISCTNTEQHNYGYTCYTPETITIDGFTFDDLNHGSAYTKAFILGNYNKEKKDDSFIEKYPYIETKRIYISKLTVLSGTELGLCTNKYLFGNTITEITE